MDEEALVMNEKVSAGNEWFYESGSVTARKLSEFYEFVGRLNFKLIRSHPTQNYPHEMR